MAHGAREEWSTATLVRLTAAALTIVFLLAFVAFFAEQKAERDQARGPTIPLAEWVENNLEKRLRFCEIKGENGLKSDTENDGKITVALVWTTMNDTYDGTDKKGHARAAFIDEDGNLQWLPTIVYTPLDGQNDPGDRSMIHAGRYRARVVCDAATQAVLGTRYQLPADLQHEYEIKPYRLDLSGLKLQAQDKYYDGTTNATITDAQICLTGPFEGQTAYLRIQGTFLASQSDFGASVTVTDVELIGTDNHRTADFDLRDVFDLYTSANIQPLPINAAQAEFEAHRPYTGSEQTFTVNSLSINGLQADFTVSGNTATDVGSYEMTVYGIGNFTGTLTLPFEITEPQKPQVIVQPIADVTYDGTAHAPSVSVTQGETTLVQGRDYVVSYNGGTEAGTATATVMLQGEYNGSISRTYSVNPKEMIATDSVLVDNNIYIYTGEEIIPVVTVMDGNRYLKEGRDYDLTYVDNVYPGTGSVTVQYKGNYKGSVTLSFEIQIQNCTTHWLMLVVFMILVVGSVLTDVLLKNNRRQRFAVVLLSSLCTVTSMMIALSAGCLVCCIVWLLIVVTSGVRTSRALKCRPGTLATSRTP